VGTQLVLREGDQLPGLVPEGARIATIGSPRMSGVGHLFFMATLRSQTGEG